MIRTKVTISAVVFLALAGSAALGNNKWTGNGGSNLWNDAGNWQKGIPNPAVDAQCQIDGPNVQVLIDATHVGDQQALCGEVRVSYTANMGAVTLTVAGGTLRCTDRLFIAAREGTTGTVVIDNAGQVTAAMITLGRIGDGVITLKYFPKLAIFGAFGTPCRRPSDPFLWVCGGSSNPMVVHWHRDQLAVSQSSRDIGRLLKEDGTHYVSASLSSIV